jgi:hypothetical protein
MKLIGKIVAVILIFFGVMFVLGAFSTQGTAGWIIVGIIVAGIGLGLAYFMWKKPPASESQNITYNVQLPGDVKWEGLKCQSCGGALSPENVKMIAGAPVVTCPYCHTTYQMTEEPKW